MAACVRPEEVYISVLVHFFVHPPPVELVPAPDRRSIARHLAVFLLKELKEPDSVVYPTLAQLCAKLRNRLDDLGSALVRCLETTLLNLRSTHDVYKLFSLLEKLLVRKADVRTQPQGGRVVAGLDPLSPLGLFLRKQRLAFLSMSFEAVAQLFTAIAEDLKAEMAPGGCFAQPQAAAATIAATTAPAAGAAVRTLPPREEGCGNGGDKSGALRDRAAFETYVSRLMQRIEQQGPSLFQAELDAALAPLERLSVGQGAAADGGDERAPLARLLRLQAALQHRDYTAALDLLHSYYNCMAPGPAGRNRNASGLLNLSQLHAGLGHTAESLQALNETLRLAQQCGDPIALLHALSVLCRLLAATAPGAPGLPPHNPAALRSSQAHHVQLLRMLRRCGERGRELGQPQLAAFAQLAAARFVMMHDVEPSDSGLHAPPGSLTAAVPTGTAGASAATVEPAASAGSGSAGGELRSAPLMVSCALRDSLALATAASLSAAAPAAPLPVAADGTPPPPQRAAAASDLYSAPLLFDRSLPLGAAATIANSVQQLGGAAHLLQAAAWALHGHNTLERAHTMMYLAAFSDSRVGCGAPARFEDRSTACAQLVSAVAQRGPAAARAAAAACLGLLSADASSLEDSGSTSTSPAVIAAAATTASADIAESVSVGHGSTGGGVCNSLALWGGSPLAAAWLCAAHDRALALGDTSAAMQLVGQLGALADPQPHRDVDLRLEAARRGVLTLMAAGSTSAAQQAATELFARCADAGFQAPALRCLLLQAEVHLAAGDAHGAFPHVLACLLPAQPGPGPGGGIFATAAAGGPATVEPGSLGAAAAGGGAAVGGTGGRSHDLLAAEALVLLCRVWHELSDGQQLEEVLVLLQDALPLILAHGSVQLQARTQFTMAEMVMSEARSHADLAHCYTQLQRLLAGAVEAATAAEDFRLAALAACMLAWLHQGQGAISERDAAAELHEALVAQQARAEVACAAEGRTLDSGAPTQMAVAESRGAAFVDYGPLFGGRVVLAG